MYAVGLQADTKAADLLRTRAQGPDGLPTMVHTCKDQN